MMTRFNSTPCTCRWMLQKIGYDELEFSTCSVYAELKRVNVEPGKEKKYWRLA